MERFKAFSVRHPLWFGVVLLVAYAMLTTLTYPVHFLFSDDTVGILYGDALSKLVVFGFLVGLVWRFGWLNATGLGRLRLGWAWPIIFVVLVYKAAAELHAFTGSPVPVVPASSYQIGQWFAYLMGSLVEETISRGLVLLAMLTAWGDSRIGILKSVVLSSVVFGATHLFNLISAPVVPVLFQTMLALVPGILYAALFLATRSLWPAIVLHWVTNALVNTKIATLPGYTESPAVWTIWAVALIPLLIFSLYLVWRVPEPYQQEGLGLGWAA